MSHGHLTLRHAEDPYPPYRADWKTPNPADLHRHGWWIHGAGYRIIHRKSRPAMRLIADMLEPHHPDWYAIHRDVHGRYAVIAVLDENNVIDTRGTELGRGPKTATQTLWWELEARGYITLQEWKELAYSRWRI